MQPFSKRNNLKKEYSGYGEASVNLRNRLLQLYGLPYSGNEYYFGVGNTNWIHEVAFDKDLQMHFGKKVPIESFRDEKRTPYNEVFDFIELYFQRAQKDLDSHKRLKLLREIVLAFQNSGSVYEFSSEGQVLLKINEVTANKITKANTTLEPFEEAQNLYQECVDGLLTRTKAPKDIIGDMYIVFEEYFKKSTGKNSMENAIQLFRSNNTLHPAQIQVIEKLKAYRGDVWGAAHAGNSPKPDEEDSLWYLESVITQINYINNKLKQPLAS